jgi:hypothetical protein
MHDMCVLYAACWLVVATAGTLEAGSWLAASPRVDLTAAAMHALGCQVTY